MPNEGILAFRTRENLMVIDILETLLDVIKILGATIALAVVVALVLVGLKG